MQAVMYHYVRPKTESPPFGYYHLDLADFRAQLDHFEESVGVVDRDAFFGALRGNRSIPDDGVVLTFDDALLDHHRWVLPELRSRDLWGVFFVPTGPLSDGRRLAVHRIHALVGAHPGSDLLDAALAIVEGLDVAPDGAADPDDLYPDRDTPDAVRSFKHLLNDVVPRDSVERILDRLEDRFPIPTDPTEYYLSPDQLSDLDDAGMIVGAHSVSHSVLANRSIDEQRREVRESKRSLDDHLDQRATLFAYPYGTAETYTEETKAIVADAGFDAAFTTEASELTSAALDEDPYALPRVDCNQFPYGESTVDLPAGE